jgi:hypothetical protein
LPGATPTSHIAGKAGIDLREHGLTGATNVYRILGWKYATRRARRHRQRCAGFVLCVPRGFG